MTIAFLGPHGTYTEEATIAYGGADVDRAAYPSIPATVAAVHAGTADAAVLPIENSIEGAVSVTLDLLIHETDLKIRREVVVPIRHLLIAPPGASLERISKVVSHPQALGQCRRFLERALPNAEQVAALSTARAIELVVADADPTVAAIGPARAHELYGGDVIADDVQDAPNNLTRFVALATEDSAHTGDDKTSIVVFVKANVPGVLSKIIAPFSEVGIQLTKIESRPTKGWLGDYVFLIDFEGHRTDSDVQRVLDALKEPTASVKMFGSYPRYPVESLRPENALPTHR